MSEVIVRMEMPDWCPCELAIDNNGWFSPCFAYDGIPSRDKEFDDCIENRTRPSWCPILGVLPEQHGRLVDAKHFEVVSYTENEVEQAGYCWRSFDDGVEWLLNQVDATPTIVPATER